MKQYNHSNDVFVKLNAFDSLSRAFCLFFERLGIYLPLGLIQAPFLVIFVIVILIPLMAQQKSMYVTITSTSYSNGSEYKYNAYSGSSSNNYNATEDAATVAGILVGIILASIALVVVSLIGTGAIIRATAEHYAGEQPRLWSCLKVGFGQVCRLCCFGVIMMIPLAGMTIVGAILVGIIAGVASTAGDEQTTAAVTIASMMFLLPVWLLGYFYVMIPFQMAPPSLVLERRVSTCDVVGRAWKLASGSRGNLFLATLMLGLLNQIIALVPFVGGLWVLFSVPVPAILATVLFIGLRADTEGFNQAALRQELGLDMDDTGLALADCHVEKYFDLKEPMMPTEIV